MDTKLIKTVDNGKYRIVEREVDGIIIEEKVPIDKTDNNDVNDTDLNDVISNKKKKFSPVSSLKTYMSSRSLSAPCSQYLTDIKDSLNDTRYSEIRLIRINDVNYIIKDINSDKFVGLSFIGDSVNIESDKFQMNSPEIFQKYRKDFVEQYALKYSTNDCSINMIQFYTISDSDIVADDGSIISAEKLLNVIDVYLKGSTDTSLRGITTIDLMKENSLYIFKTDEQSRYRDYVLSEYPFVKLPDYDYYIGVEYVEKYSKQSSADNLLAGVIGIKTLFYPSLKPEDIVVDPNSGVINRRHIPNIYIKPFISVPSTKIFGALVLAGLKFINNNILWKRPIIERYNKRSIGYLINDPNGKPINIKNTNDLSKALSWVSDDNVVYFLIYDYNGFNSYGMEQFIGSPDKFIETMGKFLVISDNRGHLKSASINIGGHEAIGFDSSSIRYFNGVVIDKDRRYHVEDFDNIHVRSKFGDGDLYKEFIAASTREQQLNILLKYLTGVKVSGIGYRVMINPRLALNIAEVMEKLGLVVDNTEAVEISRNMGINIDNYGDFDFKRYGGGIDATPRFNNNPFI